MRPVRGVTVASITWKTFHEMVNTFCYNPESAGSQAPGPDVRACRRRSDIPVRGGLIAVSRHYVACET